MEGGGQLLDIDRHALEAGHCHDRRPGGLLRRHDARHRHAVAAVRDPGTGADTLRIRPLTNKYAATALAVILGGALAMLPSKAGDPYGTGGLILWPLFGATNQMLAGLAFLVTLFYLWRRNKPVWFIVVPTIIMLVLPMWGLTWQMFHPQFGWWAQGNFLLLGIGIIVLSVQIWIVAEGLMIWRQTRGVLEEALPPLATRMSQSAVSQAVAEGGRSC